MSRTQEEQGTMSRTVRDDVIVDVIVSLEGDTLVVSPTGYLGSTFDAFRLACREGGARTRKLAKNGKWQTSVTFDALDNLVLELESNGFTVALTPAAEAAEAHFSDEAARRTTFALDTMTSVDAILRNQGLSLFPYQRDTVSWLTKRQTALVAHEMGLGKTICVICALPPNAPVLIVAPALAKGVWARELKKWRPDLRPPVVLSGQGCFRWPAQGETVIVNYDVLSVAPDEPSEAVVEAQAAVDLAQGNLDLYVQTCRDARYSPWDVVLQQRITKWQEEGVRQRDFQIALSMAQEALDLVTGQVRLARLAHLGTPVPGTVLVADEAHVLKNKPKTQRTPNSGSLRSTRFRALSDLALTSGGRAWLVTATPLLNRPAELWAVLSAGALAGEAYGSWDTFCEVFRGKKAKFGGMVWGTPTAEANERFGRVAVRKLRAEVLPDLPKKMWRDVPVELAPKLQAECNALLQNAAETEADGKGWTAETMLDWIEKQVEKGFTFRSFSALRALIAEAKIPALMELVESYEDAEEPLVVFSAHRAPVDVFQKRKGWAVITGDVPPIKRTQIEDRFQAGELKGVAGTIDAMGVSITLTRACHVVFTDRKHTPGINAQAEDRVCRIGQKRPVLVTNLVGNHPLDEHVAMVLARKQKLLDVALEGKEPDDSADAR